MPAIFTYALTDIQIYQEYQITNISSASAALQLAFQNTQQIGSNIDQAQRVILEARGDNVIFNFGGSAVAASKTITSSALPAGNFSVAQGAIFGVTLNGLTQNFVSCITQTSGGTGIIRLGTIKL